MICLAQIVDEGTEWKLIIYPEAQPVEEINEVATKGYRATLGYDPNTDRHVVMTVWYNKATNSIGEVLKKIDEMKACPRCSALDKARLDSLTIETQPTFKPIRERERIIEQPVLVREVQTSAPPARKNVKDMFANALFDAYLTPAGKLMVGNVFGDEDLVEQSMPSTPDELAQLWSDTTSGKLLRSPDEAREFISVIRGEPEPDTPAAKAKQKKATSGIVIY